MDTYAKNETVGLKGLKTMGYILRDNLVIANLSFIISMEKHTLCSLKNTEDNPRSLGTNVEF